MTHAPAAAINPAEAMREVADLGKRIAEGAKLFGEIRDEDVAIATTPKDEVWREDKVTLYRYRPLAEAKVRTPVLIVYGLIGRYTMADLQEDRSLVRNLLRLGVDLYVVDWGNPTRADRWLTIDDYVDDYLAGAVAEICAPARHRQGQPARHLRRRRVHDLLRRAPPRYGQEHGLDHHADRLPRRQGAGAPRPRLHQSLDPQPDARGHRPADRGARHAAGRVHGLGVLDDDADADDDEVQPRHARGHGRQEEAPELPAHGEMDRRPAAPSRRGGEAMAEGSLPGQQARAQRVRARRAQGRAQATSPCRCSTSSPRTTTSSRPRPRRRSRGKVGTGDYTELALPGGHVGVFVGGKSQGLLGSGIASGSPNGHRREAHGANKIVTAPTRRSRSSATATRSRSRASSASARRTS